MQPPMNTSLLISAIILFSISSRLFCFSWSLVRDCSRTSDFLSTSWLASSSKTKTFHDYLLRSPIHLTLILIFSPIFVNLLANCPFKFWAQLIFEDEAMQNESISFSICIEPDFGRSNLETLRARIWPKFETNSLQYISDGFILFFKEK